MRYAVFSDIHSNLEAYMSGLEDMAGRHIDTYLCAGDIVGYGADPSRCIAETRRIAGRVVAGNHDRAGIGRFDLKYFNSYARTAVVWTGTVMSGADKDYLSGLALTLHDGGIDMVHGTLDEPEGFRYVFDAGDARATFGLMKAHVCFIGHTHVPAAYCEGQKEAGFGAGSRLALRFGKRYVINVGSIGQPRDGDPRGAYVIYDTVKEIIELCRFSYDMMRAAGKILDVGLPPLFARRLLAGR